MSLERVESIRRFRVLEIMDMVMRINGTTPTHRELTGNKPTAFMNFNGHTATVRITINANGWQANEYPDIELDGHLDDDKEMEEIIATLLKILAEKEKSS